jgi:hypothetical protein
MTRWLAVAALLALAGCTDGAQIGRAPGGSAVAKHCDGGNLVYTTDGGIAVVPGGCR